MGYKLESLGVNVSDGVVQRKLERLTRTERPRLQRLWAYYRNPMQLRTIAGEESGSERPYLQAQEWGLPSRITGLRAGEVPLSGSDAGVPRKEVVIENDIGWRIDTGVDYLMGKPLVLHSGAADPQRREVISQLLRQVLAHNGGLPMLQQIALLGAVYGFVDVLVKLDPDPEDETPRGELSLEQTKAPTGLRVEDAPVAENAHGFQSVGVGRDDDVIERLARRVRVEIVEPARALPFLSPLDYRHVSAYGQCYEIPVEAVERPVRSNWWQRMFATRDGAAEQNSVQVVEIISATHWQRYENGQIVEQGVNSLGRIPLVHIQNSALPLAYSGGSDVEPLIPLQDELNTRLSDRANRITLQSFRMYLGKNIPNFTSMPIGPGRMWMSDDERAEVVEFGGDDACPSEEAHISDIREAMDKLSAVSPIAAGAIKNRIGRLTSAAALRVTLMSLLAKTERKRTTYGNAIEQICELALAWLDAAGLFRTEPAERRVEIHWPSPLPENDAEKLQEAEAKARLGVSREVLLRELGY